LKKPPAKTLKKEEKNTERKVEKITTVIAILIYFIIGKAGIYSPAFLLIAISFTIVKLPFNVAPV
jgi:hypothetical protein